MALRRRLPRRDGGAKCHTEAGMSSRRGIVSAIVSSLLMIESSMSIQNCRSACCVSQSRFSTILQTWTRCKTVHSQHKRIPQDHWRVAALSPCAQLRQAGVTHRKQVMHKRHPLILQRDLEERSCDARRVIPDVHHVGDERKRLHLASADVDLRHTRCCMELARPTLSSPTVAAS